jgi:hypothetical protein
MAYSDAPLSIRVDGGEPQIVRGQQARVLRYWADHRHVWRTEFAAAMALRSTVVHSRMADLKRRFGELFDSKEGPKRMGVRGRKLYRLRQGIQVEEGTDA